MSNTIRSSEFFTMLEEERVKKNAERKNSLKNANGNLLEKFAKEYLRDPEKIIKRGSIFEKGVEKIKEVDEYKYEEKLKTTDFSMLPSEDQILQYVIKLINIPPIKRAKRDVIQISEFLETTDLCRKFKTDRMEESILNKLLFYCSTYIEYQYCKANEVLFKIFEKADKFYIILKGEMKILKPMLSIEMKITAENYFLKLIDLVIKNQSEMVRFTIIENHDIYPISQSDINNLKEILFRIKYRKSIFSQEVLSFDKLNDLFSEYDKDIVEELDLSSTDLSSELLKRKSLNYLHHDSKNVKFKNYLYLENGTVTKNVKFFTYDHFHTLKTGNIFGDFGLENKTQTRTATIQAVDDCQLGFINIKYYHEFISYEKQKIASKDLNFILANFFFKNIPQNIFKLKYFSDFISCEYSKGDYLFKENTEADYVYFIKEGEVHLSISHINLKEINALLKDLTDKLKIPEELTKFEEISESEYLKKRKVELFYSGIKQVLGVEEHCFGLKRYCSAKVLATKNKIFKISIKLIERIYKEEDVQADVLKFGKEKILKLINRLQEFRRTIYKMIHLKNQLELDNFNKISHENNFTKFLESKKSPKINSIEQILNVKEREFLNDNSIISEFKQKKFCYKNNMILIEDLDEKFFIEEEFNSSRENNLFLTNNAAHNTALPKINNNQSTRNNNSVLQNRIIKQNELSSKKKFEKNAIKTSTETRQFTSLDNHASFVNVFSFEDALMKKIKKIEKNTLLCSSIKNESTFLTLKNENEEIDLNSLVGNYKKPSIFSSLHNDSLKKKEIMNKINCRLVKRKNERNCTTDLSKKEEKDEKEENQTPRGVKQLPSFKVRSSLNYIYNNIKRSFCETHNEKKSAH